MPGGTMLFAALPTPEKAMATSCSLSTDWLRA
jgi:hypothetical protein